MMVNQKNSHGFISCFILWKPSKQGSHSCSFQEKFKKVVEKYTIVSKKLEGKSLSTTFYYEVCRTL